MKRDVSMRQRVMHWLVDQLLQSHYFTSQLRERHREFFVGAFAPRVRGVPYRELPERYRLPGASGRESRPGGTAGGRRPIFVSGRFRSGSTFLWNIFRHTPGVTAYYEPLNERQWFREVPGRGAVDPTHLGVGDYWKEYEGLGKQVQGFDPAWTTRDLYMDRYSCNRAMERYLSLLIEHARERPVLQCNRFDFRLDWLRHVFPDCQIVFLYRDPREQWMSVQKGGPPVPPDYVLNSDDALNLFYELEWARDLRRVFPMLDLREHRHPYSVHYTLWRLSYLFGVHHADIVLAYEDLVENFAGSLQRVFMGLGQALSDEDVARYGGLLNSRHQTRWPGYAPAEWFERIELDCEERIGRFFGSG